MNPKLRLVRWFNHACPWNQHKYTLKKWVARSLPASPEPRVFEGIQRDLRMRLSMSSDMERAIYLNAFEVVYVQLIRRLLKPGDVYIDAGANLGFFCLVASKCIGPDGRIYAFEPVAQTFARLRENLDMNGATNVVAVPNACGEAAGEATIHVFADGDHGRSSLAELDHLTVDETAKVPVVRIDDVVKPPVKLIKIDVEGAEWSTLKGAEALLTAEPRPHLVIEHNIPTTTGFGYHPMEMVDWLLERRPNDRLHLITSRKLKSLTRDRLATLLDEDKSKIRNVWFEPGA